MSDPGKGYEWIHTVTLRVRGRESGTLRVRNDGYVCVEMGRDSGWLVTDDAVRLVDVIKTAITRRRR